MKPELPDWIIEGMHLTEEREVLRASARAAWRQRDAAKIARLAELHQILALRAATVEPQIEQVRALARAYKKNLFTAARAKP